MKVKSSAFDTVAYLMLIFALLFCDLGEAAEPPRKALKYRRELTRIAHQQWGLDAPIPAFAAQIHQESFWRPDAVSRVGAKGMAQFMPGTAKWWCEMHKLSPENCQPTNPRWAMRAMIGYDKFLLARVHGQSEYDRFYAALRSYNGGLGHWLKEARLAKFQTRKRIDAQCGKARRHRSHCKENLGYPKRILNIHQPKYAGWGRVIYVQGGRL